MDLADAELARQEAEAAWVAAEAELQAATEEVMLTACAVGLYNAADATAPADCQVCEPIENAAEGAVYTCSTAVNSHVSACQAGQWPLDRLRRASAAAAPTAAADRCR